MNEPIDHHYLPVFYLKQWCGDDGKVVRYYRPYRKVVPSPVIPENTGYEPNLYSLEGFPPDLRVLVETHYMGPEIDQPASEVLSLLLSFKLPTIDAIKRAWARFLMSLALRNPQTLAALKADMRHQLIAQLRIKPEVQEEYRASGDPRDIVAWLGDLFPQSLLKGSGTLVLPLFIEELSKPFHAMRWFVFDLGRAATSLLTSDRPLFGRHGFGDPRCIVALPLSPRLLFVAANTREPIQALQRQPPETIVGLINEELVTQAAAHVYGNTKAHLAMVEKYLRPK